MTAADVEFARILSNRVLDTVFQPVIRLDDGAVVAFEALVRGPAGSHLFSPSALLAEAYRSGRVVEFDWAARASACRAAMAADLSPGVPLLLNIEPLALDSDCPTDLRTDITAAYQRLDIVLEITERSLDGDTRSLLDGVRRVRDEDHGVAIDDVGANAGTLSMLTILEPELIKLDRGLIHQGPTPATARVLDCVYAESERTGASLLAEGVETPTHAAFAHSLGARLAQGRRFGAPGPLRTHQRPTSRPLGFSPRRWPALSTPFDAVSGRPTNRATKQLLILLGEQLRRGGANLMESAMLLVLLPESSLFGPAERGHLSSLAEQGVLTGVLGPGIPARPGEGIRGGYVGDDDMLRHQWAVVVLSPHAAGALLARALPDTPTEFEYAITHDRGRVAAAARCLLRRLGPSNGLSPTNFTWESDDAAP